MVNIYNSNFEQLRPVLLNDEYWDVCLADSGTLNPLATGDLIFSWDHSTQFVGDCIVSKESCVWPGAITTSGYTLYDYGFTAVDDGSVLFDKDTITRDEFLGLYTGITYSPGTSKRFFLCPVSGNTKRYVYPYGKTAGELTLNGGFYQGTFKTEDCKYQLLPDRLENDLYFRFGITPKDFERPTGHTLLDDYPDNFGTFFYIGLKAPNKWSRIYNSTDTSEIERLGGNITASEGYPLSAVTVTTLETDNKFITYNRAKDGFRAPYTGATVRFWDEGKEYDGNPFLLFNRTPSGQTACSVKESAFEPRHYDDSLDLGRNALGFQITPAGEIAFKYIVMDCETGSLQVKSGKTKTGLVPLNVTSDVTIRLHPVGVDDMLIYLYANGNLVYISEKLPRLNLRPLHDRYSQQNLVPYCISLGGGVQGLLDAVYANYNETVEPRPTLLEQTFAGSFIGYINRFDIYERTMEVEYLAETEEMGKDHYITTGQRIYKTAGGQYYKLKNYDKMAYEDYEGQWSGSEIDTAIGNVFELNKFETVTIPVSGWTLLTGKGIYNRQAVATIIKEISEDSTVELYNDDAVLFSTHGFAIGSITGQQVTLYAIDTPGQTVSFKINVQ